MSRREARQEALRILYLKDLCCSTILEAENIVWGVGSEDEERRYPPSVISFARQITYGVCDKMEYLDNVIKSLSENWSIERMPVVDRNILRMAIYEILFIPEVPRKVAINEAVDLAKKFSGEKAKVFINGILDKVKVEMPQPSVQAPPSQKK